MFLVRVRACVINVSPIYFQLIIILRFLFNALRDMQIKPNDWHFIHIVVVYLRFKQQKIHLLHGTMPKYQECNYLMHSGYHCLVPLNYYYADHFSSRTYAHVKTKGRLTRYELLAKPSKQRMHKTCLIASFSFAKITITFIYNDCLVKFMCSWHMATRCGTPCYERPGAPKLIVFLRADPEY